VTDRATLAIVRRHIDRRFALDWTMQFFIVGAISYALAAMFPLAILPAVATLAAVTAAERSTAKSLRRLTFFTAPLYGRQLARAHAVAPALGALSIPLGYACGTALRGHPIAPEALATAILVALVATLVSLSSVFRDGARATLYVALAIAAGFTLIVPLWVHAPYAFGAAVTLAIVEGFLALRAFGETLARYDPLP